jgi:hypothetical protein
MTMKPALTVLLSAALLAVPLAGTAHAGDKRGAAIAGGIIGLATGIIVGGALANQQPAYAYPPEDDEVIYVPQPRRVYVAPQPYYAPPTTYVMPPQRSYEAPVQVERRKPRGSNCVASVRYDYQGKPFEWLDCQ